MSMQSPNCRDPFPRRLFGMVAAVGAVTVGLAIATCDRRPNSVETPKPSRVQESSASSEIPLPATDQHLCTAVVILVDTSGSMQHSVRDRGVKRQPKHVIARDALENIISYTGEWKKTHADRALQLGVYSFSSSPSQVLPMGEFNLPAAQSAASRIPPPSGGTAIGDALAAGFKALYQSGCTRKYLICVTDGENTVGPPPSRVASQLYKQTKGDVEIHFVAFDTSPAKFSFLKEVNGNVVQAADGEQLQARLSDIYEKRILAETMPAEK
jgi:Mg-chelatase subunit ChlD